MAKQATKRTAYRDSLTGRFVKESTYKRSKSQGGTRYKREIVKIGKHKKPVPPPPPPPPPPEVEVYEYIVSFSYEKSGRTFDVIVTARSEEEARQVAGKFLKDDARGQRIPRAGFTGWQQIIAKGERTNEEAGNAEYREDSEDENGEAE